MSLHIVPQVDLTSGTMTVSLPGPKPALVRPSLTKSTPCDDCWADGWRERGARIEPGSDPAVCNGCAVDDEYRDLLEHASLIADGVRKIRHMTREAKREHATVARDYLDNVFGDFDARYHCHVGFIPEAFMATAGVKA